MKRLVVAACFFVSVVTMAPMAGAEVGGGIEINPDIIRESVRLTGRFAYVPPALHQYLLLGGSASFSGGRGTKQFLFEPLEMTVLFGNRIQGYAAALLGGVGFAFSQDDPSGAYAPQLHARAVGCPLGVRIGTDVGSIWGGFCGGVEYVHGQGLAPIASLTINILQDGLAQESAASE
jgi:hypothetical protein